MPAKGSSSGRLSGSRGGSGSGVARGGGRHASPKPTNSRPLTNNADAARVAKAKHVKDNPYSKVAINQGLASAKKSGSSTSPSSGTRATAAKQGAKRRATAAKNKSFGFATGWSKSKKKGR